LKGKQPKVFNRDLRPALNSPISRKRSKGKIEVKIDRNVDTNSKISKATEPLKDVFEQSLVVPAYN